MTSTLTRDDATTRLSRDYREKIGADIRQPDFDHCDRCGRSLLAAAHLLSLVVAIRLERAWWLCDECATAAEHWVTSWTGAEPAGGAP